MCREHVVSASSASVAFRGQTCPNASSYNYKMYLFFLAICFCFVLKSVLSDINIVSPVLL